MARWRIEVSANCRLAQHEDAFGNVIHNFSAEGRLDALKVHVEGDVETQDTAGIVRGAVERFPPSLFLRETPLAHADTAISSFAEQMEAKSGGDPLTLLHGLMSAMRDELTFDTDPTHAATTAAEAFALKRGVCQDFAHLTVALLRSVGIAARYVSGYFYASDPTNAGASETDEIRVATHAWVEVAVPEWGWWAIDPTNASPVGERHVKIGHGRDYDDVPPVRGVYYGQSDHHLAAEVTMSTTRIVNESVPGVVLGAEQQ